MLAAMRPDLAPTACLPFEADEARRLVWLPLAVRHKLDVCGLRLSLTQWQTLSRAARLELLELAPGTEFVLRAVERGANRDTGLRKPVCIDAAEAAQLLDCDADVAGAWLAVATPFAHYVLTKLRNTAPR